VIDRVTLNGKLRLLSDGDVYADAVKLARPAGRIANSQLQAIRGRAGSIENLVRHLQDQEDRDWAEDRWYYKDFFRSVRGALKRVEERAKKLVAELGQPGGAMIGRRSQLSQEAALTEARRRLVRAFVEHFVAELQYYQAPRPRDPVPPPALAAAQQSGSRRPERYDPR
jgi:hypothetical protein